MKNILKNMRKRIEVQARCFVLNIRIWAFFIWTHEQKTTAIFIQQADKNLGLFPKGIPFFSGWHMGHPLRIRAHYVMEPAEFSGQLFDNKKITCFHCASLYKNVHRWNAQIGSNVQHKLSRHASRRPLTSNQGHQVWI